MKVKCDHRSKFSNLSNWKEEGFFFFFFFRLLLSNCLKKNKNKNKKWGKTLDCVSCFPLHFFRALPLPACFTTEHSTVEASLFVNYYIEVSGIASGNKLIKIGAILAKSMCR